MWQPASTLAGATWRKSTFSGGGGAQCVELARVGAGTAVRDSKFASGPAIIFPTTVFSGFLLNVKAGQYDLGR
ncbi:DUF397 domain-containing protein [Goodfellowiella coeruleoviolacea]|uniref:DUF397 domain-containing protein n=1 Tax=Goodfellowiella coeruleoviolacea TaxID=334858 RepID=UPI0020A5B086|nr:DUF397 domain-containing protein [Goodfellowiella coeruleoviolacea]